MDADFSTRNGSLAIKKTLTIPKWLDDLVEEQYVNGSQVLQDA